MAMFGKTSSKVKNLVGVESWKDNLFNYKCSGKLIVVKVAQKCKMIEK